MQNKCCSRKTDGQFVKIYEILVSKMFVHIHQQTGLSYVQDVEGGTYVKFTKVLVHPPNPDKCNNT